MSFMCLEFKFLPFHHPYFCQSLIRLKGIYLSKALTCMKLFLYKKKLLFYQGDRYFWPHCCMNNLYISHRSLYAPTYSFWAIGNMLISCFRITSWFDTVCNIVTDWMNLKKTICMNMNYNYLTAIFRSILTQILSSSGIIYNFSIWPWKIHTQKLKIYIFQPEMCTFFCENTSKYCSRIKL